MVIPTFVYFAIAIVHASFSSAEARPPPKIAQQQYHVAQHPAVLASSYELPVGLDPLAGMNRRLQNNVGIEIQEGQKLRSDLLLNYDRGVYPWKYAWTQSGWNETDQTGTREGLGIEVGINFHRVFSVDIVSSVTDLIVWFRLRWTDPRLSWDPEEYGGITNAWFWVGDGLGSAGEMSEIWTPDLELWNMESSLTRTLTDTYATVDSTGAVFWSRPGHLRAACRFGGLDSFPFDNLLCTMEIGSWSFSGLYLRPTPMNGVGFTVGGSETAEESFTEYQLSDDEESVGVREKIYPPFPGAPEEDWPVLLYDIRFHRSWQPYARGYIFLQVMLNCAGFAAFWLPVACGERMSLAITALLAAVASELVVAANLPATSEMTWFQRFSLMSLAYGAFALFESAAVIFFFYYTGNDLVPGWWRRIQGRTAETFSAKESEGSDDNTPVDCSTSPEYEMENDVAVDVDGAVAVERGTKPAVRFKKEGNHSLESQETSFDNNRQLLKGASVINVTRGAEDFNDMTEVRNNKRWKKVSLRIDQVCRVIVPIAFAITLGAMLSQVDRNS